MTEAATFAVKPEDCESHTRNYRQTYEYPNDLTVYVFTCLLCGYQWRQDGPLLDVQVSFTMKTEVKVDVIGYFNLLSGQGVEDYKTTDIQRWADTDEEWQRPFAFLLALADNMTSDGGGVSFPYAPFPQSGERRIVQDRTEEEDAIEVEVRVREGKRAYNWDWTPEDFETLRLHVEWLDLFHRGIDDEDPDEDRAVQLARIPGPNDDPLFQED